MPPRAPVVGVPRLVHPADLGLDLRQNCAGGVVERGGVERDVVVGGDEGGGGREIAQDDAAGAPRWRLTFLGLPDLLDRSAVSSGRRTAPLGGDAGHTGTAESVENHVAGLRVVEDGRDDRQVRHLGVVAVRPVERVGLAGADVDGERLAVVRLVGVVPPAVVLDELGQERVGARRVVRGVGQPQDVLVLRYGEVGPLPQLGEPLLQSGGEVLPARLVRLEGHPEALDRTRIRRRGERRGQLGRSVIRDRHRWPPSRRSDAHHAASRAAPEFPIVMTDARPPGSRRRDGPCGGYGGDPVTAPMRAALIATPVSVRTYRWSAAF